MTSDIILCGRKIGSYEGFDELDINSQAYYRCRLLARPQEIYDLTVDFDSGKLELLDCCDDEAIPEVFDLIEFLTPYKRDTSLC